jgi:hypothetical protein
MNEAINWRLEVQEADDGREHLAAFQPSLVVEGAQ